MGCKVKLNSAQQGCLVLGAIAIVVLAVYVPWTFTLDFQAIKMERAAGYSFVMSPPLPPKDAHPRPDLWGAKVDVGRVLIPMGVVIVATGVAVVLTGQRAAKPTEK
jgi:hypothetical protein